MKLNGKKWELVTEVFRDSTEQLFYDCGINGIVVKLIGPIPGDWCTDADSSEEPPLAIFNLAESINDWLADYDSRGCLSAAQREDIIERKAALDRTVALVSEKFASVLALPSDPPRTP